MFTGIIQGTATVLDVYHRPGLATVTFDLEALAQALSLGASVSVSGVCLTVVATDGSHVVFDVMQETLDRTTLGSLKPGDRVNIERSVKFGDEIGGHLVSGHVTDTARIANIETTENNRALTIEAKPEWLEAVLPKGFIAIDGASLTVGNVSGCTFVVHLIPETLTRTTFGTRKVGDFVNLELDSQTVATVATVKRMLGK